MIDGKDLKKFTYIFIGILIITILLYLVINRIPYTKGLHEKIFRFRKSPATVEL